MRVVIDTNVFVSAVLKDKSLPALAVRWAVRHATVLKSATTERQLFDVLARPYFVSLVPDAARNWLASVLAVAEPVTIMQRIAVCRDATDDRFLELAVEGRADVILSGDADLLVLHPFRGIPIVTPAAFVTDIAR